MTEPGLVPTCDRRPESAASGLSPLPGMVDAAEVGVFAVVGVKP